MSKLIWSARDITRTAYDDVEDFQDWQLKNMVAGINGFINNFIIYKKVGIQ